MTVKELIDKLLQFEPSIQVRMNSLEGDLKLDSVWHSSVEDLLDDEVEPEEANRIANTVYLEPDYYSFGQP